MTSHAESPSKLTVVMTFREWGKWDRGTRTRTLRYTDGVWIIPYQPLPTMLYGSSAGTGHFDETPEEVTDFTARVIADMLNAGDIEPTAEHLRVVRAAIQPCGSGLRLQGHWDGWQDLETREMHKTITVAAWMRCGRYIAHRIAAGDVPSGTDEYRYQFAVPGWWWPLDKLNPTWITDPIHEPDPSELAQATQRLEDAERVLKPTYRRERQAVLDGRHYYMGRDGGLLRRLAEIEVIEGLSIFDLDYRTEGSSTPVATAIAHHLLADEDASWRLRSKASHYLQTKDNIRHWHCNAYDCRAKHRTPKGRCSNTRGGYGWLTELECCEAFPCLHDDPESFRLRFI